MNIVAKSLATAVLSLSILGLPGLADARTHGTPATASHKTPAKTHTGAKNTSTQKKSTKKHAGKKKSAKKSHKKSHKKAHTKTHKTSHKTK